MSLRKSDKIIAVLGVIILICAGLGVLLYQSAEEDEDVLGVMPEKMYSVTWVKMTSFTEISGYAGKANYVEPIVLPPTIADGCVLTEVRVNMTWNDDRTMGLIFNKGEDTLKAEIGLPGEEPQVLSSTGGSNGKETISFMINDQPYDRDIEDVDDEFDAEAQVLGEYTGMNTATLDVNVKWTKGESILTLRPLKLLNWLLDKGNGFKLVVSYDYYEYVIEEVDGEPPAEPPADDGNEPPAAMFGLMVNAGMTRW